MPSFFVEESGWPFFFLVCGQVKKLQAEKRLDLLVDIDLKTDYNPLELEEMVQVKTNCQ
jgi:hypothetical protein